MKKLLFWCAALTMVVNAGTSNGKFTIAFWGDSRSAGGSAPINICGHILANKGTIYDISLQDGDFTEGGSAGAWTTAFGRTNVSAVMKVKDFSFMCTSDHDVVSAATLTEYGNQMGSILPSNGSNCYYYYKSWPLPNSTRKVHVCAADVANPHQIAVAPQIAYFTQQLASAGQHDWVICLMHSWVWNVEFGEGDQADAIAMQNFFQTHGGDLLLMGDAHIYLRSNLVAASGSAPVLVQQHSGAAATSTDEQLGLVHIINGRGGNFEAQKLTASWDGWAVAPNLSDQVGIVTKLEFDDNKVTITSQKIGGAPGYAVTSTVDGPFTWTRGPASTVAVKAAAAEKNLSAFSITRAPNGLKIALGMPGSVSVFDLKGTLVRTIGIGVAGNGMWDEKSATGEPVKNGIYVVKADFGSEHVQSQVMLAR